MSRIHDALKKAEQDRASCLHVPVELNRVEPLRALEPVGEEDGHPDEIPSAKLSIPTMQGGGPLSIEGWIAACPSAPWKPDLRTVLFAGAGPRQAGMEEFRTLRTRLTQMREKLPLQTILVASALPSEGKTFISANLALAFVQQRGRRALLIDGDLRLSCLHTLLGAERTPGLSEYLMGKADVSAIMQRGIPDNLFLIPGGESVSNPMELIGNGRLKGLLHRLAPLFDWIVIDSPPCVPLSDASLLAEHCDGVLMVVRAGKTPFDMAQRAGQQFRDKRLLGVVLNEVEPRSAYSAYYYHSAAENPENAKK